MKKYAGYIIAGIIGFLLAIPATSFGAQIHDSLLGKKVQNEYVIVIDGKQLDTKAVAIDGVSYAPLRSIAEAINYNIKLDNKTVSFDKRVSEGGAPVNDPAVTGISVEGINFEIDGINIQLRNLKGFLDGGYAKTDESKADTQKKIDECDAKLKELQQQKADLAAQQTPTP